MPLPGDWRDATVTPSEEDLNIDKNRPAQTNVVVVQLGVLLVLLAVYFLQAATPLRLHHDSVILLSVAESAEHGGGFLYHGQPTLFPPGYPALLAILMRANLAHVWVFIGLNVAFLAIGLLAVRHILVSELFSERYVLGICILTLLSFVPIRYSTIPLTDALFFGISMCCLAIMKQSASAHFSLRRVVAGAVLIIGSVCVRRIGIALIPAFLYMVIFQSGVRLYLVRLSIRKKAIGIFAAASVCLAIACVVRATWTLWDFKIVLKGHSVIDSVTGILTFRLRELGEIALNLPSNILPPAVQDLLLFIGFLAFSLAFAGVVSRRKQFGVIEAYFIGYAAVVLVWPYYDPRFWLPVLPLLLAYSGLSLKRLIQGPIAMQIFRGYVLLFAMAGLVAIASSTALSFSRSSFANAYPEYRPTYCAAWHCKDGFDATKVDEDALHLLHTYK